MWEYRLALQKIVEKAFGTHSKGFNLTVLTERRKMKLTTLIQ